VAVPSKDIAEGILNKGTDGVVSLEWPPRLRFRRMLRGISWCAATPPVPGWEYAVGKNL